MDETKALRLECLRLAVMIEQRSGVANVMLCADALYDWATKRSAADVAKKEAAKK